jgi:hypothetical protein
VTSGRKEPHSSAQSHAILKAKSYYPYTPLAEAPVTDISVMRRWR